MSDLFPIEKYMCNLSMEEKKQSYEIQEIQEKEQENIDKGEGSGKKKREESGKEERNMEKEKQKDYTSLRLPMINLCKSRIRGHSSGFIVCNDIFKEIDYKGGSHSNIPKVMSKMMKNGIHVEKLQPNVAWNCESLTWDPYVDTQNIFMVMVSELKPFLISVINRTRKNKEEKLCLIKKFNITLSPEEIDGIKVPIENKLISLLYKVCPFAIETSYRIGNHIIDAFIPRLRMAIMIDEYGHKNYNFNEERDYNTLIRDHNMILFRFNPHESYVFDAEYEFIRRIWELTLSPELKAFVSRNY